MYDIITMGSNTVDMFCDTDLDELIEIRAPKHDEELIAFPLGTKVPITDLRYNVGGNGVNVAVGLARLGINAGYLGKIGRDANGEQILQALDNANVNFIGARGETSGVGLILNSTLGHDRTILGYKGCNNTLKDDEVPWDDVQANWYYLSSMLETSYETMQNVAAHATHNGATIAFNPSSTIAHYGYDHCAPILEKTDYLIINEEEAQQLAQQDDLEANISYLHDRIPNVVVTRGNDGVICIEGNERCDVDANTCDVVETTGAGDAFSAGFLAGKIHGKPTEDCVRIGMHNAESVLCHYGAHNKLLTWDEAEERLNDDDHVVH
jgi:sugar/nucleoside kinase (ribokinase family)